MRRFSAVLCVVALVALSLAATPVSSARVKKGSARNMQVVGHNNLGGRGFNADVWVHEG